MRTRSRASGLPVLGALILVATMLLAACQGSFPADAQGTLEEVRGGVLRVGISENPPWTVVDPDGSVRGTEVDLIQEYAQTLDAEVEWLPGGESAVAAAMRDGRVDLAVGGFPDDAPWTAQIAFTRPYRSATGPDDAEVQRVMGVRPGENALLVDLESFLAREAGEL